MWCFLFILLFLFRFVLVGVKVGLLSNRANMLANFFVERDRGTGGVFSKILFFLSSSCLRLTYLQMFREVIPFSYSNMTMVQVFWVHINVSKGIHFHTYMCPIIKRCNRECQGFFQKLALDFILVAILALKVVLRLLLHL